MKSENALLCSQEPVTYIRLKLLSKLVSKVIKRYKENY
jgi:hypothetical protein